MLKRAEDKLRQVAADPLIVKSRAKYPQTGRLYDQAQFEPAASICDGA
ncbi:hypothetical protein LJK87_27655 [Paenibacillus sp. P25]|nr:hypothetical protein LJK87_27655 [Paenibacillus sp. P25]